MDYYGLLWDGFFRCLELFRMESTVTHSKNRSVKFGADVPNETQIEHMFLASNATTARSSRTRQ